jgi:hypothetical protein
MTQEPNPKEHLPLAICSYLLIADCCQSLFANCHLPFAICSHLPNCHFPIAQTTKDTKELKGITGSSFAFLCALVVLGLAKG